MWKIKTFSVYLEVTRGDMSLRTKSELGRATGKCPWPRSSEALQSGCTQGYVLWGWWWWTQFLDKWLQLKLLAHPGSTDIPHLYNSRSSTNDSSNFQKLYPMSTVCFCSLISLVGSCLFDISRSRFRMQMSLRYRVLHLCHMIHPWRYTLYNSSAYTIKPIQPFQNCSMPMVTWYAD